MAIIKFLREGRKGMNGIFARRTHFPASCAQLYESKTHRTGGCHLDAELITSGMANDIQNAPPSPQVAEPAALFQALSNPVRLDALRRIALNGPQSVAALSVIEDLGQDSISRHMTILWKTGAVIAVESPDGDRRKQFYDIPPDCLRTTATGKEIDYGSCVLRF